ncbi:oxygen-independent coproporphyrinogen III oxidase [Ravibacter arvi]|uniref:Coproporphyrinogen-III oxidase n=1 Tax=Ravibacter arvi TaxID=2051041 RepID=A0ABP8M3B0_9BACT
MSTALLEKYDVPAPRYTSYPTVPFWDTIPPDSGSWEAMVQETFESTNLSDGISLYVHLPFCERLCTYCGCNTRITINHGVEKVYIAAVLKEWSRYRALFGQRPRIRELHFGGGTPTFFSAENLDILLNGLLQDADLAEWYEFSFEAHPGNTTSDHLRVFYQHGFRRISIGVQDFDPKVLEIINRFQTRDEVEKLTADAREMGYQSINFDLVYGLPLQQHGSFVRTIEVVCKLRPDRIALYSYAHVPWIKPGQRKFTEADLPSPKQKLALYSAACERLLEAGYIGIGMDHFSLPGDRLNKAAASGTLHRNFMGYTTSSTRLLIGLGVSAISDAGKGYVQNEKVVEKYYGSLEEKRFPFFKGHLMSPTDLELRRHILNIMCRFKTEWNPGDPLVAAARTQLEDAERDGLLELGTGALLVTPLGRSFLRNICMAFDQKYWLSKTGKLLFSQAV